MGVTSLFMYIAGGLIISWVIFAVLGELAAMFWRAFRK